MFLKKSFESAIQNISEAVIGIDKNGILIIANNKAEELLSINSKEDIGKYIEDVVPETKLNRILKTGKNELNKNFFANNREFITSRIAIYIEGTIKGAIAVFQDITDNKRMKQELLNNEMYIDILNTIMNTLNECIVLVNEMGVITMMSKAYKEFLGCSNPEGKDVRDVIENTKLYEVIKNGNVKIGDIQEINGNKMIAVRVPIKEGNKIIGAVGKVIFKDIGDFYTLSRKLNNLEREIAIYKNELGKERKAKYSIENIIGRSSKIQEVKSIALKVAKTDSNVLITGESGTGKELFAHGIHNASGRYLGPFIEINCAAIPSELFEAELFGYEEGAFTGAKKGGKKGKFELANGGTIFLDEIGDMPMHMQVKLLKVIQDREIERIGGNIIKEIDVRIIAATNRNLENHVKQGKFREDLYYRLNVMRITLPPLRDRKEDISLLANNLRIKIASKLGIYVEGISKEAMTCITKYDWPGNVRELENVIERAIDLLDSDLIIKTNHLPKRLTKYKLNKYINYDNDGKYLKDIISEVEKHVILNILNKNNWNKNKTANILGISRAGLYKKIEEYKLKM
ncbi:sigma-54 dependent transcription regulator [Clostridium pasteurianum DSM 525 = ATCC 6013]|uniref:PAS modulated sigma54 specific transcriptional regulator, Fis family n=1 Tax=Clostridium pasteurianum DSM 525 = ATCC 6013 TaxID=1262449 RepID=A0A0H3J7Z1_CLOPA|nr:sigma-54-dependent Fis family transcriptional regulator [Clostridium pasteurianum]AJA50026.1 sigma-54 dependent transcription regulator [Clostridium pasteurianum DSM 525 = ATCC 6013]AJA54014.1 sigma-54 dependent transcription regulator [Clostridium pasteurianum DSM 525 = ATCC 6013]AOZ77156.1 AAA family ATPase [Clostridium pasteurianum DSM 525 = ATCC 6013]AOZ80953.1 AAA family ATPase [Clostridium pasteurianum]ELP59265.1 sigma-54 dependent transcription regulator [Clostridium pasteurianum DSM